VTFTCVDIAVAIGVERTCCEACHETANGLLTYKKCGKTITLCCEMFDLIGSDKNIPWSKLRGQVV
jgi:hypothetical protein